MKKILLFLLIGMFCQVCFGQGYNTLSGYIVTYQQDTIHGLIKDRNDFSEKIIFKAEKATAFKAYSPEEIAIFFLSGGQYNNGDYYYKAIPIPGEDSKVKKVFVLWLAEGELSLYQYKDAYYVGKGLDLDSLLILEKKDVMVSSSARKEDKRYIGHLKYLTKNCAHLQGNIDRTAFKADDLSKVIHAYNHCITPSTKTVVASGIRKSRVKAGMRVSAIVNSADFYISGYDINTYPFTSKTGYSAGLFFQFPFRNKLAFQPEVLISQKGVQYKGKTKNQLYEEKIDFNITYIQVPLSVYYIFPTYKLRPFVGAGGVFSYALAADASRTLGTAKTDIELDSREVGYRLSTGISYPAFHKRIISLEYMYEENLVNKSVLGFKVHMTSHHLSLRMTF